jgi:hypothetical protein
VLRQALSAAPATPKPKASKTAKSTEATRESDVDASKGSVGGSDSRGGGDGDDHGAESARLLASSLPSTSDEIMLTSLLRSELMRQALQIAACQPGRQRGKGISSPSYASFMLLKAQLSNGGGSADGDNWRETQIEQRASKTAKVSRLATQNLCHAALRAGGASSQAHQSVVEVLEALVATVCGDLDNGGTVRAAEHDDPRLSVALSSISAIAQLMPKCYALHARRVSLVVESLLTRTLDPSAPSQSPDGDDDDDIVRRNDSDSDGDSAEEKAWQQVDLVRSCLGLLTSQLSSTSAVSDSEAADCVTWTNERARQLVKIAFALLENNADDGSEDGDGGSAATRMLPRDAEAGTRLVAAESLLTYLHCASPNISASPISSLRRLRLARTMQDSERAVRLGFVNKLAMYFDPDCATSIVLPCVSIFRVKTMHL